MPDLLSVRWLMPIVPARPIWWLVRPIWDHLAKPTDPNFNQDQAPCAKGPELINRPNSPAARYRRLTARGRSLHLGDGHGAAADIRPTKCPMAGFDRSGCLLAKIDRLLAALSDPSPLLAWNILPMADSAPPIRADTGSTGTPDIGYTAALASSELSDGGIQYRMTAWSLSA